MPSTSKITRVAALSLLGLTAPLLAVETILYETDFSNFAVGDDQLAGSDGWLGTNTGQAVHGTIEGTFEDGNVAGTLGFEIPTFEADDNVVSVWRPISVNPVTNDTLIRFSADIAIIDSDNALYDSFYFSVFNQNVDLLAAVVFDNTIESEGIWSYDGADFTDTRAPFNVGQVYDFSFTIDYANNLWSASLDDLSLFEDITFTESNADKDLGDISAEWEVTDPDNAGTNWLYFDNWKVSEISRDSDVTFTPEITLGPDNNIQLSWTAADGETFQVEYSNDLQTWMQDLADSAITVEGENGARFVDESATAQEVRFYRVSLR